jgi:hypothetical protein
MLIDRGMSSGEVVSIKLVTGEEIIAKLIEETATDYKISKPMVLSVGQQGMGMIPMMFTVDPEKDLKINKSSVIVVSNTETQFANQYLQGTTGIAMK